MAEWYYRLKDTVQGPVSEGDLKHIFESGALPLTTPIWCEGMEDWNDAEKVLASTNCFAGSPLDDIHCEATASLRSQRLPALPSGGIKWFATGICLVCLASVSSWIYYHPNVKHDGLDSLSKRSHIQPNVDRTTSAKDSLQGSDEMPPDDSTNPDALFERNATAARSSEIVGSTESASPSSKAGNSDSAWASSDRSTMDESISIAKQCTSTAANRIATHNASKAEENAFNSAILQLRVPAHKAVTPVNDIEISPRVGKPEVVRASIEYLQKKVNVTGQWKSAEIGCIGKSDLWTYRMKTYNSPDNVVMAETEMFLLSDLDPTSGKINTRTDTQTGRSSYSLTFKCANNEERVVGFIEAYGGRINSSTLRRDIIIQCEDDSDAKRIGKALAVLIFAAGGRGEMFDDSDRFEN